MLTEKADGCQVECIQNAYGRRERLQCALQYPGLQLEPSQTSQEQSGEVRVRAGQTPSVESVPEFVLEKPAAHEFLAPELRWRTAILGE